MDAGALEGCAGEFAEKQSCTSECAAKFFSEMRRGSLRECAPVVILDSRYESGKPTMGRRDESKPADQSQIKMKY